MEYVPAKHLVNRSQGNGWFGTDCTMNVYRGCCHGCIYCDSRSECYHVPDFDTVKAKANALELIRNDLQRKVKPGIIGTGAMSDPYNPFEEELQLTRHALELMDAYGFGVAIATKSDLIVRDLDVLGFLKSRAPVLCKLTVTTTNEALAKKIEPRAPSPARRLAAIQALSQSGLFAGVLLMPVLPFLEDTEDNVLAVVEAAAAHGAKFVYPAFGMTLRQNQRDYYFERLDEIVPGLRERYLWQYGNRYNCVSPQAKKLWAVFTKRCNELGLLYEMKHIVSAYQRGYGDRQLSFFD